MHCDRLIPVFILVFGVMISSATASLPEPSQTTSDPEKLNRLAELKAAHPELYQQFLNQERQSLKTKLMLLEQENPEAFEKLKSKFQSQRRKTYARLMQDPSSRDTWIRKRQENLRLLKEKNPDQYERLRQRIENRMQRKVTDSDAFDSKNRPGNDPLFGRDKKSSESLTPSEQRTLLEKRKQRFQERRAFHNKKTVRDLPSVQNLKIQTKEEKKRITARQERRQNGF